MQCLIAIWQTQRVRTTKDVDFLVVEVFVQNQRITVFSGQSNILASDDTIGDQYFC